MEEIGLKGYSKHTNGQIVYNELTKYDYTGIKKTYLFAYFSLKMVLCLREANAAGRKIIKEE